MLAKGYDVLAVEADAGSILMEMPQTADRRSFQVIGSATADGAVTTVQLRANLRAGVFVKDETMKPGMCGVLAELQGGKAGIAAANKGKSAVAGGSAPTVMTAQALSGRVSNDSEKNPDEIPLRYQGRAFTLSGTVERVRKDGDTWHVVFEIMDPAAMQFRLPGQSQRKTDIVCLLAQGQSVYALTLKPRARITLTGTYSDYRYVPSPSVMWLDGCVPGK